MHILYNRNVLAKRSGVSSCNLLGFYALAPESRGRAETLEQERDRALQKLQDLEPPQQVLTDVCLHMCVSVFIH